MSWDHFWVGLLVLWFISLPFYDEPKGIRDLEKWGDL